MQDLAPKPSLGELSSRSVLQVQRVIITTQTKFQPLDGKLPEVVQNLRLRKHDTGVNIQVGHDNETSVTCNCIGTGANAKVFAIHLRSEKSDYKLAIKQIDDGKYDDEKQFLLRSLEIPSTSGILRLAEVWPGAYALRLGKGSCEYFCGKLSVTQTEAVVNIARCQHADLLQSNLEYLDFKPANLICDSTDPSTVSVGLADLGSTVSDNQGKFVMTFEAPFVKRCYESGPGLVDAYNTDVHDFMFLTLFLNLYTDPLELENTVLKNFEFYRKTEKARAQILPQMISLLKTFLHRQVISREKTILTNYLEIAVHLSTTNKKRKAQQIYATAKRNCPSL